MNMNEAKTRQLLIDKKLHLAGWNIKDNSQVIEEFDINLADTGTPIDEEPDNPYAGHRFVDYTLLHNGNPIAVVEAKRTSKSPALGKEQAMQYAQQLQEIQGGRIPFIFYTNGYETYFWESDFYPPVKVYGFPTRNDLEWLDQRRENRKALSVELIDTDITGRDYQVAAIRSILENIEAKKRKLLLVMATGTGKTRTAAALFDVLIRARWAKRVLFLVDRIALRDQALDAFKEHIPSEPRWPNPKEKDFKKDRRVYVTTYPTMLNLIQNGTTPENWISPHFFDMIIADESHRSIYNTYKQVLDYFNALKLGLTATPKDHIDHDTFQLFNCDTHDPTFSYSYEEARDHDPPFLCDFEVLKVRSKFQLEGIKGETLSAPEQRKLIAEGKDVDEIDFEGTDLERKVTNAGTNAVIVREFMEESIKDPTGTLPGKSIFFAITKEHARRLQKLFDNMYPEHRGVLARVLVSEDSRVHGKGGLLDQFKNKDMPRVAISVDMLDTGVDVREAVNLVFAKPVYSYVKFWQMIGRGTRVLEEDTHKRKPWCPEKDKFLIIDCWGNFEYFKMKPKGREPGGQVPLPVKLFKARLDKLAAAMTKSRSDVVSGVKQALRKDIEALPENNVLVSEHASDLAMVKENPFWNNLTPDKVHFLRTSISPVLRARTAEDFKAVRFETEIVELGTARINENADTFNAIRESIVLQISELPLTVNIVAKEKDLIEGVQRESWWCDVSEEKLDSLVDRLGSLMRFREKHRDPIMKLDIRDLTLVKEWIEFGPEHERMNTAVYREKLEKHIRELLQENLVLQKIKAGEEIGDDDIRSLAVILENQELHVTENVLKKVYDNKSAKFIQFIRHIMGLEKLESFSETVTHAFDEFIKMHNTYTALQIQFLQTLKTFLLQTEKLERENLISRPFTNLHPQGIRGIFNTSEINEILEFAEKITEKAA